MFKDHRFWLGVAVGYLLIALFPQLNMLSKFKSGGSV
jgi:hypothetical protein